jgi:hypothetical protein
LEVREADWKIGIQVLVIITIRAGSSPVSRTIRTKKSPASEFVRNDGLAFFEISPPI